MTSPSIVQTIGAVAGSGISSIQSGAFGSNVANGNDLLAFVAYDNTGGVSISSVTDTAGNTYSKDGTASGVNAGANAVDVWRAKNVTGGASLKITAHASASTYVTILGAAEVTPGNLALDGGGSTNTGSGSPASTGAFSTANANDLLVCAFALGDASAAGTIPSGFTTIGAEYGTSFQDGGSFYETVSSAQTNLNPSWAYTDPGSHKWAAIALAYKLPIVERRSVGPRVGSRSAY